jgi:hypothetical protein
VSAGGFVFVSAEEVGRAQLEEMKQIRKALEREP